VSERLFTLSRVFRAWLYSVSHSTLLLRSIKEPGVPTRIDVIFKPVRYLRIPTTIDGLELHLVEPGEIDGELTASIGPVDAKDKLFALAGPTGRWWIVGGVVAWHEDDGSDFAPSHFSVPRMVLD
jgi:hypothetical protein